MLTLIIGGSGSGKSAYAENYAQRAANGRKKYYLATMQSFDKESLQKIERHRMLRQGKQFETIEQPYAIAESLMQIDHNDSVVLLECMTNLVANELFRFDPPLPTNQIVDQIIKDITALCGAVSHVIIVTGNVFEDGVSYDDMTMEYCKALGQVNQSLAAQADHVIEVVVGIPVAVK